MQLPSDLGWMDAAFLGALSAFLLAWVQYWKKSLPESERFIRIFSALSSVGLSYLLSQVMKTASPMSILAVVLYGLAAAIFSDFAYQFLSASASKAFTLPSQSQLNEVVKKNGPSMPYIMAEKELEIVKKKAAIRSMNKELEDLEKK